VSVAITALSKQS